MNSPYYQGNVGAGWGPGNGISAMLALDRQTAMNTSGATAIADTLNNLSAQMKETKAYRAMAVDALGMDKDQVDNMSLGELKGHVQAATLQGQIAQNQALAQERQARAAELQARMEESQAIPAFATELMKGRQAPAQMMNEDWQPGMPWTGNTEAPGDLNAAPSAGTATGTAAATPTGAVFSPQEIMGAMSRMGATNPRLGAAMMRVLIPKMMSGEMSSTPGAWTSPQGNPYVYMGKTFMPDKAQMDPAAMMNAMGGIQAQPIKDDEGNVLGYAMPSGKGGGIQKVSPPKEIPQLPHDFWSAYHELEKTYNQNRQDAFATDQQIAEQNPGKKVDVSQERANRRADLLQTQTRVKNLLDNYRNEGYGQPQTWQGLYSQFELKAPSAVGQAKEGSKQSGGKNVNTQAIIDEANKAISAGADPDKVKARLKEKYGIEVK